MVGRGKAQHATIALKCHINNHIWITVKLRYSRKLAKNDSFTVEPEQQIDIDRSDVTREMMV